MRTLWAALFSSIGIYYVFTRFADQPTNVQPNRTLSLTLVAVGLSMVPISIVIKRKFLNQSVEQQQDGLVQQGYVIAWAVTEVAALLGILDFYMTGNPYYFILFIIAACGQLLHFPRRQHVLDACFKNSSTALQ
jgi:drug/metabolite transporter (DMT)-like permease